MQQCLLLSLLPVGRRRRAEAWLTSRDHLGRGGGGQGECQRGAIQSGIQTGGTGGSSAWLARGGHCPAFRRDYLSLHGDGLSHKDFNFQEVLTTSTICGICRSKLATPSSEVRYLGTNTIEEELMLAIKDPLRADSVRGHDSALPVRCQKYTGPWAHLGSLCPL